jgi:50S ribosomal subunit-associated GTPase HflX
VFNKIDLVDADEAASLRRTHPEALFISALTGEGRQAVVDTAAARLEAGYASRSSGIRCGQRGRP